MSYYEDQHEDQMMLREEDSQFEPISHEKAMWCARQVKICSLPYLWEILPIINKQLSYYVGTGDSTRENALQECLNGSVDERRALTEQSRRDSRMGRGEGSKQHDQRSSQAAA